MTKGGRKPAADIRAGISGWTYAPWRGVFFPKGLASRKELAYAAATFRKDKRVNIRISGKDLEALQKWALEEGLPYQTLISSLIHKFVSGRLQGV